LTRRKDQQEDIDIDVLYPHRDYPTRPDPVLALPPNLAEEEKELVEKTVGGMTEVMKWAEGSDGDEWEGFFLGVDMLTKEEVEDEE
jgi:hypothetical protein